jgi:YVTN family beta-propeller protein
VIRFLYTLCFMASSVGIGALQAQPNARPAQKLYIINTAGDDVTVTDVATNKVLGRIEVGPRPHGIAASAAGDLLLVTVEGGKGELVWIDPATDKVVRRLRTGSAPNQLAVTPDGKFAFVPVSGGNYEVVDVAQAKIIDKIFTGGQPHNTVCSADGQRMYLAPIGNPKKVTIVDVASRKVLGEIPFSNSVRPVAITKDEKKFFAQVDGLVGIEMADVPARKMIHRVPAEIPPELKKIGSRSHGLGIRPGDKEVWDCDVERKVVHVYDITGDKPRQTATIPIGGTVYWLTFGPDGKYCYVSVRSRNEVAVVDTATREVVARIPTGKEPKRLLVVEMRGPSPGDRADPEETSDSAGTNQQGAHRFEESTSRDTPCRHRLSGPLGSLRNPARGHSGGSQRQGCGSAGDCGDGNREPRGGGSACGPGVDRPVAK